MAEGSKVALIIGASGGIGREVSIGLGLDGYELALVARSKDQLDALAHEIMRNCGSKNLPLILAADLTIAVSAKQVVMEVMERYGRIDILFNAIGIYRRGNWEIALTDFEEQMSVNVTSVFNIFKAVVPEMLKHRSGHIITVSSRRGLIASAEDGAYSASKHAVVGMSEALYKELAPKGIKVTVLCPGWVDTPMVKDATFPKQEMINTRDILETVRFLIRLSPAACVKEVLIEPRTELS